MKEPRAVRPALLVLQSTMLTPFSPTTLPIQRLATLQDRKALRTPALTGTVLAASIGGCRSSTDEPCLRPSMEPLCQGLAIARSGHTDRSTSNHRGGPQVRPYLYVRLSEHSRTNSEYGAHRQVANQLIAGVDQI